MHVIKTSEIKLRMYEKGLTQKKMAEYIGISLSTYNQKINNKREFTLSEAMHVSKILNLENPCDIFFSNPSQICNEA